MSWDLMETQAKASESVSLLLFLAKDDASGYRSRLSKGLFSAIETSDADVDVDVDAQGIAAASSTGK